MRRFVFFLFLTFSTACGTAQVANSGASNTTSQSASPQPPAPAEEKVPARQNEAGANNAKPASQSNQGAQSAPGKVAAPDDSKEAVVIERLVTKVAFEKDGTGTRETSLSARVLSQSGVQALAVLSFAYVSSNDTVEFDYVRVRKPDGSVVTTPDYNVLDMPAEVTRIAPMYSDLHEKHVTVKALGVGDVLEYLVRFRTVKPQVPGQFWFDYNFPKDTVMRDHELQISVPRDKYVKVVSPDYKPEIREENDRRVYSWKTSNPEVKPAEAQAETPPPDVEITTFRSWEEVGRWYSDLQAPQVVATPAIQARAAELTKGLSTEDEKLRAIYDFVSTHFHYVSLSFGVGRYQPHAAQDVLENEYGDCKDKHTLLASLLGAAGIQAWPVAINASRKIDPDLPSPGQFDHVITYVPGEKGLWLDTTPEVAPFGMLMANLRDKQALVIPKDKPAELKKTPAEPPFPSVQSFAMEGSLSKEGTLTAHVKQAFRGDAEVLFRLGFRNVPAARWKELAQNVVSSEGFGGEVDNVAASSPEDTRTPFEFSYDYTRKNFGGDWENRRITAPFPPFGVEAAAQQEKKPLEAVALGAPGDVVYTAKLTLPLDTIQLPTGVDLSEPWADFHSKYSAQGKTLAITRHVQIKQSRVPLDQWEKYKNFAKAVDDDHDSWIVLTGGTTIGSKEQQDMFDEGLRALRSNDLGRAEYLFKQLIQQDASYPYAHANVGSVYLHQGHLPEAIAELRKEEELHPEETYSYRTLAHALERQHDTTGAIEQLQKLLSIDPKDWEGASNLAQLLSNQKRYSEATAVLEKATALAPDSQPLELQLGLAYLKSGGKDKAMPVLQKALDSEQDPMKRALGFNNVAYVLAEENTNLDKAEEWGNKGLQLLEAESLKTDSEKAALNNTQLLTATWDTVGWVYFRRGELDKAERYLHAAFAVTQGTTEGDHLGQVLEKEGKKEQAEHYYLLAIAAPTGADKTQVRERYKALSGKIAPSNPLPDFTRRTEGRPGSASTLISPAEELSKARSFKIPSGHQAGSATFSVVFAPGTIVSATFISGDEKMKPMADSILSSPMRAEFPSNDLVRLNRRGLLYCGIGGCELTLLTPDNVHATE